MHRKYEIYYFELFINGIKRLVSYKQFRYAGKKKEQTVVGTVKSAVMSVGVFRRVVVPSPSSPTLLNPHVKRRPLDVSAEECSKPNEIWVIVSTTLKLKRAVIFVGVLHCVVVPSPSWPSELRPHVKRRPFDVRAEECKPKETWVIVSPTLKLKRAVMSVGVVLSVVVPSPSWPYRLYPRHVPLSLHLIHEWLNSS